MKNTAFLPLMALSLFILASCGNNGSGTPGADSAMTAAPTREEATIVPEDEFAGRYIMVSGKNNLDTALLNLRVNDSNAEGDLTTSIYEKDKRHGTFKGTLKDSVVNAVWTFTQEGMKDSIPLVFKISGNIVEKKKYGYDAKTGKEIIPDTAGYTEKFLPAH